jgi:predicted 3-demethylubiquinone-9 3-methyltransferase (glyoxalase superfamily)
MMLTQKIVTNLWFDNNAEDAVNFYTSVFKDSKAGNLTRYSKEGYEIHQRPEGSVMTIEFELAGQSFLALNGGPVFKFNEAVSFIILCENQEEIDYYWEKLGEGGDPKAQQCGWLKDKFGVSWQVVPKGMQDMLRDHTSEQTQRVMNAFMKMKKIIMAELEKAYNGEGILV